VPLGGLTTPSLWEDGKRLSVSTRSIDTWVGKRMIPYIQITPRILQSKLFK
jgi:hypothetical protein